MSDSDLLDKHGAAQLLDCEPSTAEDLARQHKLPAAKLGRSWLFPREALLEHINQLARDNLKKPPPPVPAGVSMPPPAKRGRPRPVLPDLRLAPPAPPQ